MLTGNPPTPKSTILLLFFRKFLQFPRLTVEDNIRFGLRIKRLPEDEIEKRVERMLDVVGLMKYRTYFPQQLSASMEQRVVIARNLPSILIFCSWTNPTNWLDVKLRYYLEDELMRIWKELGSTVAFITHNIEEAVYLAERILILSPKPSTIKEEVIVDLPRPRQFDDPKFVAIRDYVTEKSNGGDLPCPLLCPALATSRNRGVSGC